MSWCSADTAGSKVDEISLIPLSKIVSDSNGLLGFRNQLEKSLDNSSPSDQYIYSNLSESFSSSAQVALYMEGSEIASKNYKPNRIMVFMPLNTESITLSFKTSIECSVKLHIKFFEISDPNATLKIDSFDDSTGGPITNQVITFYNSTLEQSRTFSSPVTNGKEGYFVLLWAAADDIQIGNNPNSNYDFFISSSIKITPNNARTWLNKSRTYYNYNASDTYPDNPADVYPLPYMIQSTIYDSCTTPGTRCDQYYKESGVRWRQPCSIEVIEIIDTVDDGFTFTYYHDDQFSNLESSSGHKEFITITDTNAGTSISSPNLNINVVADGINKWRVDITGRDPNTDYSVEIKYKNNTGDIDYETSKTFIIKTEEANNKIDAPILYNVAQEKTTPDRITVRFVEIENVDSYDLIVRTGGVFVTSHHISTIGVGTNKYVNTDGLTIGTVYDFELIANVSSPWVHGNNNHRNGVMKIGWLDDPVMTLTSTIDSITVTYPPVVNAETYIIICTRVDNGVAFPYGSTYNSPYTIGGLSEDKEYKITIDAFDGSGVYKTSHSYQNIFTLNPITYLDKPCLIYQNNGPVSNHEDVVAFNLKDEITNANSYEIIINGVSSVWNLPTLVQKNVFMEYGTQYTVKAIAHYDSGTQHIQSESHEITMTLYKKILDDIEPADFVKVVHGPDVYTNRIIVRTKFSPNRAGQRINLNVYDLDYNLIISNHFDILNNSSTSYGYDSDTLSPSKEFIAKVWFEIPKTWGGGYEAKSVEKICRFRTLDDTDNDGHSDNHPTNPDMDNPNTTFGYGDGLGL